MAGQAYLATTQWIWCDIDGDDRWRLAVERDNGMLYFPVEDFEECAEAFENYPSMEVDAPVEEPKVRCKFCKMMRPATGYWIRYHQGEPVCKDCWDERLKVTE